jgi:hypothetical protein
MKNRCLVGIFKILGGGGGTTLESLVNRRISIEQFVEFLFCCR